MDKSSHKNVVIFLGPPGSGKGTQAKRVAEALLIPHISTGDLFRDNLTAETPLGLKVKTYLDSGKLVPDEIVLNMLMERVEQADASKGYVLDGFPRSIPQAEALKRHLGSLKPLVIHLEVRDETVIQRIEGRRFCPSCKALYNKYTHLNSLSETCPSCGSALTQRSDDRFEVITQRLKEYQRETKPLIDFYLKESLLVSIPGEREPDTVFRDIMDRVDLYRRGSALK